MRKGPSSLRSHGRRLIADSSFSFSISRSPLSLSASSASSRPLPDLSPSTGSVSQLSSFFLLDPTHAALSPPDISTLGLTDLRSRITIIPQDPTILSGSLRSTLDVFQEFEDAEIFEALRRVHLIPAETGIAVEVDADGDEVNKNVFKNLDSIVSENGENFSQGEKQLICMARASESSWLVTISPNLTFSLVAASSPPQQGPDHGRGDGLHRLRDGHAHQ
jgi:hypothetical protein